MDKRPIDWVRSPKDIAILTAVPQTFQAFLCDIAARRLEDVHLVRGDYSATGFDGRADADVWGSWANGRARVADLVTHLFDGLDSSEYAYVTTDARSEDIYKATRTGATALIVLAHWRDSRVLAADLRSGILPWVEVGLQEAAHFVRLHRYAERLDDLAYLADALNDWVNDVPGTAVSRRTALEAAAPDHVVPGNCLELRDGFHKAEDLALQIDEDWSGVLELAICQSEYLALGLKEDREDRLMITNRTPKDPYRVLPELREMLLRSHLHAFSYCEERRQVFEIFEKGLRQHAVS